MPNTTDVDSLDATATGRWLIHSRGSIHVLDLDLGTYQRQPGPTSQRFPHDNTTLRLTRVEVWPHVGDRMLIWFDDPEVPDLIEHFRLTSQIHTIRRDPQHTPPPHRRRDAF